MSPLMYIKPPSRVTPSCTWKQIFVDSKAEYEREKHNVKGEQMQPERLESETSWNLSFDTILSYQ